MTMIVVIVNPIVLVPNDQGSEFGYACCEAALNAVDFSTYIEGKDVNRYDLKKRNPEHVAIDELTFPSLTELPEGHIVDPKLEGMFDEGDYTNTCHIGMKDGRSVHILGNYDTWCKSVLGQLQSMSTRSQIVKG